MSRWIKGIALLLAIALMLFAGWKMVRGLGALLSGAESGESEPDPMFAEASDPPPTRPPELDSEQPQPSHPTLDDYVPEEESPVELTAGELIRMAEEEEERSHRESHGEHEAHGEGDGHS